MPLLEMFGLSESTGMSAWSLATVEATTRAAIDDQGWLRTVDCGVLDRDSFYTITGRIKELIVTSSGENIPSVVLEAAIKAEMAILVSNVMIVGDDRKYLTVLLIFKEAMDKNGNPTDHQAAR
ncbi:Aste57867_15023 [Aphanomyces stellatus]|uniref:Aste57867_15023 protein n=1 Tax=Aphanomyces stellatus TaxID=120398 RepID=A0A485L3F3_9STRA|nr:hypothetical protein As57867_014967 [Aphanomyces stellatus]VFT91837.1 Aste57867_15023 [Aphanomyces stellatus]